MRDRTRILVTHHLKLCVSKASYTIVLANGTIENVGTVSELKQRGILEEIIASQEAAEEPEQEEELELTLTRTKTRDSVRSHRTYIPNETTRPKPRQFVPTEERAKGSVKWNVYSSYLKASGG